MTTQLQLINIIIIITGLWISSIKYSRCKDEIAINTKVTAGAIVQIFSIICPSIFVPVPKTQVVKEYRRSEGSVSCSPSFEH